MWWLLTGCGGAPPAVPAPDATRYQRPAVVPSAVVDCNGGADFESIQAAIDAAANGDAIEVHACKYDERIDFRGKSLWLFSTEGPDTTTIDADGEGTAVTVNKGESVGTALVGFTIEDGDDPAVDVVMSALRLEDVVFEDSTGDRTIDSESGNLELVRVTIDDANEGNDDQIRIDRGSFVLKDSHIECGDGNGFENTHGGFLVDGTTIDCSDAIAFVNEHAVGIIERSLFWGTIAVEAEETHPDDLVTIRNTFVDGEITVHWGTFQFYQSILRDGTLTLTDVDPTWSVRNSVFFEGTCAIASNTIPTGPLSHNVFWDTEDLCDGGSLDGVQDNQHTNPMFVDEANEDFHPAAGSPLVDAGVAEAGWEDVDGTQSDIGLFGGRFTQDGGW